VREAVYRAIDDRRLKSPALTIWKKFYAVDAIYTSSYCNKGHDLVTGKPLAHECRVIPVEALLAERKGDTARAISLLAASDLKRHRGTR
jgi:hypothetical protein